MKIRHISALICALLLLLAAVGCANGNEPTDEPEYPKLTLSGDKTTASGGTTTTTTESTTESTEEITSTTDMVTPNTAGEAIARLAQSLVGTPYQSGGNGPDAFDNPGFVVYCYRQNGYTVPRRAADMLNYGVEVPTADRDIGDIVVLANEIGEGAGFVGIYIGNDQFVASTNPNTPTKIHKLDKSYWMPRLLSVRRAP